jgi:hypothetical protein
MKIRAEKRFEGRTKLLGKIIPGITASPEKCISEFVNGFRE